METLREDFICVAPKQLVKIAITWLLASQRSYFAREEMVRAMDGNDNPGKEFGLRSVLPSLMTDNDQYWHGGKMLRTINSNRSTSVLFDDHHEFVSARLSSIEKRKRKFLSCDNDFYRILESFQIFNEILQADEAVRQFEDIPMTS
jgi:hypothetical protein